MADMFTTLTIQNPGTPVDGETELADLAPHFEQSWLGTGSAELSISGLSKSQIDALVGFAEEYTESHPGSTVTVREEWTGEDGPSVDVTVWRGGEILQDAGAHSALLSDAVAPLAAAVSEILTRRSAADAAAWGTEIYDAASALLSALDIPGAPALSAAAEAEGAQAWTVVGAWYNGDAHAVGAVAGSREVEGLIDELGAHGWSEEVIAASAEEATARAVQSVIRAAEARIDSENAALDFPNIVY